MTDWAARAAYINEQAARAVAVLVPGWGRDIVEWNVRRHAANRWEEIRRVT